MEQQQYNVYLLVAVNKAAVLINTTQSPAPKNPALKLQETNNRPQTPHWAQSKFVLDMGPPSLESFACNGT